MVSLAPYRPLPRPLRRCLARLLRLGPADWFVDLGCGDGVVLASMASTGSRLTGVELDPGLAGAARRRLAGCRRADVLHEPVGWTPLTGATAVLVNLFPSADPLVAEALRPEPPAGVRVVTVGRPFSPWRVSLPVFRREGRHARLFVARVLPAACAPAALEAA